MLSTNLLAGCLQALLLTASSTSSAKEFRDVPLTQRGPSHDSPLGHARFASHRRLLQDGSVLLDKNETFPSEQLRNDLLENYDLTTFPWEYLWNASLAEKKTNWNVSLAESDASKGKPDKRGRKGLEVGFDINFHKIFDVSTAQSTADLLVWLRMNWTDPRLTWDPADYGGLEKTWFWIGDGIGIGGENSEIWTPDITLWNFATSLGDSMTDAHAQVNSDGSVYWSRPGHLIPACKFQGLENFPFDSLSCTMEFGSWAFSGLYLRPVKNGDGFSMGGSETSGESFSQFTLDKIVAEEVVYPPYPSAPDEDWPVLLYHVTFGRSWEPFVRSFIIVQILLNLSGFASMWLPVESGERMGLCITAVLAAIASDLTVSSQLPVSSESTWFAQFSSGSLTFAILNVFQCVVVVYFYYCKDDNLWPTWFKWICKKRSEQREMNEIGHGEDDSFQNNDGTESMNVAPERSILLQRDRVSQRNVSLLRKMKANDEQGLQEYDDLAEKIKLENNRKWQIIAGYIDEGSRVVIPATYVIFLSVVLSKTPIFKI